MGNPAGTARRVFNAYDTRDPDVIVHQTDDDGLIVAERQSWDMLGLLAQMGMFVPMPEG